MCLEVCLIIDGEKIPLNEFVSSMLGGTVVGAVSSLRGVSKNCRKIQIEITK